MSKRYTSLAAYLADGHTQEELAARLNLDQTTISRALRGKGSLTTLGLIAKAANVPLESFLAAKAKAA